MRVAAFTKYDREAASTRVRLLQFLPAFRAAGIEVSYHPLLGNDYVRSIAGHERPSRWAIARAYGQRFGQLLRRTNCDLIWVYAELFPYLPAAFERLAFQAGKPVIYDCDDAFYLPYEQLGWPWGRLLGGKLEPLIAGAAACTCGNPTLAAHASRLNSNVLEVPTVVDTDCYRPGGRPSEGPPVIGWIGSPTTWANVEPLLPTIEAICRTSGAIFKVIGAGAAMRHKRFAGMEAADWSEDSEIEAVQAMNIGIMPLLDNPFNRAKSGYKLVQYMAAGLPVVASPVGVNRDIVLDGSTGFLANDELEWAESLGRLLASPQLRAELGAAGRDRAVAHYSLASQAPRLIELFNRTARGRPS